MSDMSETLASLRGEMRLEQPMSKHTTWRAGGRADRCYHPADAADLVNFLRTLAPSAPVHVLGLGSNLLVRDGGIRGTVILTHGALNGLRACSESSSLTLYAEAGVASPKVARYCALHDLAGGEFLAGIPGTVGGALAMNAGCFGAEIWERVSRVLTVDRLGQVRERTPDEYEIGYRSVKLKATETLDPRPEFFLAAWLTFPRGDGMAAQKRIRDLLSRRVATQPLSQPNAGSVFRNPPGDFAARLIEVCGLKGRRIGAAQISEKHANFIVNLGGARAADIESLIAEADARVATKLGIHLVREVEVIGEHE